jgi:hypothetical protein
MDAIDSQVALREGLGGAELKPARTRDCGTPGDYIRLDESLVFRVRAW